MTYLRQHASAFVLLLWFSAAAPARGEEAKPAAPPAVAAAPGGAIPGDQAAQAPPPAPWYERFRFSGDFRSRYEGFYQDARETRHRGRMRFRLRVDVDVNPDTQFLLQFASGDPGTPVSTNQTFGDFFLPKPVGLDRAYLVFHPRAASALTLGAGRFAMPQTSTQMVFDEDLNYEGSWQQVSWAVASNVDVTLTALQTIVNERSAAADAYMVGGHGEVSVALGEHSLQVSVGDYGWGQADQIAVASARGPLESILTNAVVRDAAGQVIGYASDFNVVDLVAEATLRTTRPGYPLRLLVNYARNTRAATDRDSGFWIEAEYGRPRAARTWGAGYTYGWFEQDLTPSAYMFSDIPGTNNRLHMLESSYVPLPGLSLDVTLHLSKRLLLEAAELDPWLARLHVAAVVRF